MVLITFARDLGSANKLESTIEVAFPVFGSLYVPSVIVGTILNPALCNSCSGGGVTTPGVGFTGAFVGEDVVVDIGLGTAIGTLGFAGV